PKGVMVEHRSVINLVFIQKDRLSINTESKILQFASYVFDASVWEIFSAMSLGAQLSIVPDRIRQDGHLLSDYIGGQKIDVALLPPVLLSTISSIQLQGLDTLLVGGDLSSTGLMEDWSRDRRLVNAYGPTEGTVCVSMHWYKSGDLNTNIGKPLDNTKVYVLDVHMMPVPEGVVGELYIGG
ncbi:AMP-binding protein, partial [uncultured Aquimarina sp.]|uniref:AMP-binding protein n=1 Tax=uncultured Aquimarina sp. TaxID=575652 RepID=UPI00260A7D23